MYERSLLQVSLPTDLKERLIEAAGGPRKVSPWIEKVLTAALDREEHPEPDVVEGARQRFASAADPSHRHKPDRAVDHFSEQGQQMVVFACSCGHRLAPRRA